MSCLTPVFFDLESQSLLDLKKFGARAYIQHPSTRMMSLVARCEGTNYAWLPQGPPLIADDIDELTVGTDVPPWLRRWVEEGRTLVGHNAENFDAPFLRHHYGLEPPIYDTMYAARASGLPGGLDAIATHMGIAGKDERGKTAMHMLCTAKMRGGYVHYPVGTPALWSQMLAYNLQDVLITERIYEECKGREEPDVLAAHHAVNNRGIAVDRDWLRDLLRLWGEVEALGADRLAELTDGVLTRENAASVPQVKQWLSMHGVLVGSIARAQLEPMLEDPESFFGEEAPLIVEVLKLRQQLTRAMKGKLITLSETLSEDGRLRDWAVYYGAHTGRWTGRGVQPQNLSKGVECDVEGIIRGERTVEAIATAAEAASAKSGKRIDSDDILVSLVRPVFCAPPGRRLCIADYNAVEARGAAWLAGERWMLEAFADPKRDIYCEFGSKVFGKTIAKKTHPKERDLAKICVLGLQYGMSHRKLEATLKRMGIDVTAYGLTPEGLVDTYRRNSPAIVAMWREIGRALEKGVRDGFAEACGGRVVFTRSGGSNLFCRLPSGRQIVYRVCRIEKGVPGYCRILGLPPFETDLIRYKPIRGPEAVDLYGTKLVENIVQAFCRDFLAESLVKLEHTTQPAVLHCHDEIVTECEESRERDSLRELCVIMSTPPAWAGDFPLRVDGYTGTHYVKSPWEGAAKADYICGRAL